MLHAMRGRQPTNGGFAAFVKLAEMEILNGNRLIKIMHIYKYKNKPFKGLF